MASNSKPSICQDSPCSTPTNGVSSTRITSSSSPGSSSFGWLKRMTCMAATHGTTGGGSSRGMWRLSGGAKGFNDGILALFHRVRMKPLDRHGFRETTFKDELDNEERGLQAS